MAKGRTNKQGGASVTLTGDADVSNVLSGKKFYKDNPTSQLTGTMTNNGALGTYTPTTSNQSIPAGYTSGGTVAGDADLVAGNIKNGVNLFGVAGTYASGGNFSQPTLYAGNLDSPTVGVANVNYTGSGIAYLNSPNRYFGTIFFSSSLVSNASGEITSIDGITINNGSSVKLLGYSRTSSPLYTYRVGDIYTLTGLSNLNVNGQGVIYVNYTGIPSVIFFGSNFQTNADSMITSIDGITQGGLRSQVRGYSTL